MTFETATNVEASHAPASTSPRDRRMGMLLVLGSALVWSFGGALARYLETTDSWAIVFWRSLYGAGFLLAFSIWRYGAKSAAQNFVKMGIPGIAVGLCFTTASISFVVALKYTTVANILLVQAGGPLIAASLAFFLFREKVSLATWAAIALVIFGIGVMVSDSFSGRVSPIGDTLALVIALVFAVATVITRRFSHVEMVPAVTFGITVACIIAFFNVTEFKVSSFDMIVLFAFGAINLGGGLAMFVGGARLIPAAIASIIGTAEPVLGPVWVWLVHGETPSTLAIIGGLIVIAALIGHSIEQLVKRH
jgi:drug/metabolite transporter (DMT)-like permease